MPFREKSAWFVLVGLVATFGIFMAARSRGVIDGGMASVYDFLIAAVAFVVLQVVLHIVAAALAPRDANAPADEREQLIALKAARNAGFTLAAGALSVLAALHVIHIHPVQMVFLIMAALLISEIVRAASKIVYYRLGG
jgi:hypothetical protein